MNWRVVYQISRSNARVKTINERQKSLLFPPCRVHRRLYHLLAERIKNENAEIERGDIGEEKRREQIGRQPCHAVLARGDAETRSFSRTLRITPPSERKPKMFFAPASTFFVPKSTP